MMNRVNICILFLIVVFLVPLNTHDYGQELFTPQGVNFMENKSFDNSKKAKEEILEVYKDLRVADVCDAMDMIGLQDIGLMDRNIRPLHRDVVNFKHRFVGFAVTARYVPTDRRYKATPETWRKVRGEGYGLAPSPWEKLIEPGTVIVIDASETGDVGFIGSSNSLDWMIRGAVGTVTNAGARDTDEIIKVGYPVYTKYISRGIRPGRLRLESYNRPISCGGVLVFPGDVIVADGEGVIVVPRERALEVGKYAGGVRIGDGKGRLKKYKELNLPVDETVEKYKEKDK